MLASFLPNVSYLLSANVYADVNPPGRCLVFGGFLNKPEMKKKNNEFIQAHTESVCVCNNTEVNSSDLAARGAGLFWPL